MAGAVRLRARCRRSRRADAGQAGEARVLQLLDADGHGDVVGAAGHGVAGVAERLGAGGAVVLEPAHRLVVDLERARQREPALAGEERAEPEGVDVVERHARPSSAPRWTRRPAGRSTLLSQCSPNGVQPMPTIATRSRMPLLAMSSLLVVHAPRSGPGLPEVVVDAAGGDRAGGTSSRPGRRSSPPSGSTSVSSHWKRPPPSKSITAATTGGDERVGQAVDGVGGDRRRHVGHALGRHAVDGAALHAHALRRQVARAAGLAAAAREAELPRLGAGATAAPPARSGSGRRGGSRSRKPRQVRNVG